MCIQISERYAACGCLYYKHQVDACLNYRRRGHDVQSRKVLVGYSCPTCSSLVIPRQPMARARHQARKKYLNKSESLVHAQIEGSPQRATDGSNDGQVVGSNGSIVQSSCFASDPTDTDRDGSNRVLLRYSPRVDIVGLDQGVGERPDPGGVHHSPSEVQTPSIWTEPLGELSNRHAPSSRENTCPHHPLQSVAACPRECGWNVEQTIEEGDATTGISRMPLHHLLRDSLISAFANLSHSVRSMAVTHFSDPCRGTNSHTTSDIIELDTLQDDGNPGASTSRTHQLPMADSNNLNEAECPSTATYHAIKTKKRSSIPPCYLLIFLGLLTVIGSLLPGIWQARSRNDLSGGFTLAQYILGVGIFVVGSMVAIHSKTCECWKTHKPVDQVVGAGH